MAYEDDFKKALTSYGIAPGEAPNQKGSYSFESMWAEPVHFRDSDPVTGKATNPIYAAGYTGGANGQAVRSTPSGGVGTIGGGTPYGGVPTSGGGGGYGGGITGSGSMAGYSLPDPTGSAATLRELQMAGAKGLQGLVGRDTTATRKAIEDALYASQEEGINTAAERARQAMIEGTFARGVGSSSILTELAGRGTQEHADALARARREAFTQAGSEDRADLASLVNTYGTGFNAATTGLQGEANVALANLAREQQESQFGRNLAFQGGENALNRSQQSDQFGQNMGLQYAQLGQQASQFGQNLAFQGTQNDLNRTFTAGENQAGRDFTAEQNALGRQFTSGENQIGRDFAALQAQLGRDFTSDEAEALRQFTAGQNQENRTFTGAESEAQRELQRYLATTGQTFVADQNQLNRDQQNQNLLLQMANARDIASGHDLAGGLTQAGKLIPSLADVLAAIAKG